MDWRKAAIDQAFGIERDFPGNLETSILVHSCLCGLEGRLVGPHLPHEDDLLSVPRIDRAAEVGVFASRHVIFPRLDDLDASIFFEELRAVLGPFAIGLHLFLWHWNDESCDVHGPD